jgi:hypothetical protein
MEFGFKFSRSDRVTRKGTELILVIELGGLITESDLQPDSVAPGVIVRPVLPDIYI